MNTITYIVPGISCNHCIHTITQELSELSGVNQVVAKVENKEVTVFYAAPATAEAIENLLAEIHYPVKK